VEKDDGIYPAIHARWQATLHADALPLLGPYSGNIPRVIWCLNGGGLFLMSEVKPKYRGEEGRWDLPGDPAALRHAQPRGRVPPSLQLLGQPSASLLLSSLDLSDTTKYEPKI